MRLETGPTCLNGQTLLNLHAAGKYSQIFGKSAIDTICVLLTRQTASDRRGPVPCAGIGSVSNDVWCPFSYRRIVPDQKR